MILLKQDLLSNDKGIIAHGVNTRGVFGAGLAKKISQKYPIVKEAYSRKDGYVLGDVQIVTINNGLVIANCFTQNNYGRDKHIKYASPNAIYNSLSLTAALMRGTTYLSNGLYIPHIGCGLGGLDWDNDVIHIVEKLENRFKLDITVCRI